MIAGTVPPLSSMPGRYGNLKAPLSVSLAIPLAKGGGPLFRQLYLGLRGAILAGAFPGGQRLPSTRQVAEDLGVSRTVVLLAYDQLLAEGFAQGRRGSGTYVSQGIGVNQAARSGQDAQLHLSRFGAAAAAARDGMRISGPPAPAPRYHFAYGRSDIETFPFAMWRRILLRCARRARLSQLDYGQPGGDASLREAICGHLRRSRAVACDPSQVMIMNGSQQALDLIARVLIERGDRVAIEEPGYHGAREVLRAAGARLEPVAVDREGIDPARLPANARAAFVTPSHQFPTGAILPLARRLALLEWARRFGGVIVEDDYDGEFHYEGQPLESLQGLDREGRVLYIGTFSRTVFPSLRIGYLVAPKGLAPAFTAAKWLCDRHTATLEQETLAEFIAGGWYERYLRRVRRRNAARRQALLDAIARHLSGRVEVTGAGAGAHVVLWPAGRAREQAIIAAAASRGVGVYGIAPYYWKRPPRAGILLGYSRMREGEIREGIRRLAEAISPR